MASSSLRRWPIMETPKVFEVLRRQFGQDLLIYLVLAESRLVLLEAQAPQPDHNVHHGAPKLMVAASWSCSGKVSSQYGGIP